MIKSATTLGLLLAFALISPARAQPAWPPPPRPDEPSAVQLELMRRGEVLVDDVHETGRGGSARVRAIFRAEARQVWETLGDCEANFRFVDGLRECEITEESADHAITRQVAKKHWLSPVMSYRFETLRAPYRWIMIRLIDGDLKSLKGSWRFDPVGPGDLLLVTHEIALQPKMPAPRWLVRRTLQRDLQDMLACLRFTIGASLDEDVARSDAGQCPEQSFAE